MKKQIFLFAIAVLSCLQLSAQSSNNASPKHEFRATWFTTVANIDWPKTKVTTDATREQQKAELTNLLDQLAASNINAVCFQVRGRSDAYYKSNYEPWAKELTGTLGKDPEYDPLAFAIEETHKRGMELHAWINPFRVSTETTTRLKEDQINSLYKAPTDKTKLKWEWVLAYSNDSFTGQIIDPGNPAAREYVVNVLMDIVDNYDIDGVVMDDYFYPYGGTTTQDQTSQDTYYDANKVVDMDGDGDKLDDWRRSNVDAVIADFSSKVRATKPWVRFGMGPGGIWTMESKAATEYGIQLPYNIVGADLYEQLGCNTVEWIKNGWVDYVCPQIYWATTAAKQDYDVLCKWWAKDVCEHFSDLLSGEQRVHFYPSHAGYKVYETYKDKEGIQRRYEGFGDNEEEGKQEMINQIESNRQNLSSGYTGSVYFSNKDFVAMSSEIKAACYQQKALVPPMAWKATEALVAPNTLRISGNTLTWQHANAERFTVYIYPKGVLMSQAIEDVNYLQGVVYGKSFALPNSFNSTTHNVAVRSYDRYGVEHEAAEYGPDVTYVLNGGVLEYEEQVEVPTNEELWEAFKAYFNTYYPSNSNDCKNVKFPRADQPIASVTTFWPSESDGDPQVDSKSNIMTNQNSEFKWLGDYILRIATSQGQTVNSEVLWRFNLSAFFNKEHRTSYPATADFTTAGQPSAWGPAYIAAHSGTIVEPQPTQEELIANFKDAYNTYYGATIATTRQIDNFLSVGATSNNGGVGSNVSIILKDANSGWKWLGDYILTIAGTTDNTEYWWRTNAIGFFTQAESYQLGTTKYYSANFSTAGKPEAWKAAWDAAHTTAADPETSLYTLPDFIETTLTLPTAESNPRIYHPDKYTFAGWIDSIGNSIETLHKNYQGTVYAQWNSPIKWVLNGGVYTGHEELPLTVDEEYYLPTAFAMRKEGCKFAGWDDNNGKVITTIPANYTGTLYAKWGKATHVTWHPYPYYDVTNEDLWELFMEDYNAFYQNRDILGEKVSSGAKSYQPMTGAFGFTFSLAADKEKDGFRDGRLKDFMTHPKSPWRWLGDYITEVLEEENESLDSNAPLWTSFKEATGLTHLGALEKMDFATICGKGALYSNKPNDSETIFVNDDGSSDASILNALFEKPEWQWLKTYIMTTQNNTNGAVSLNQEISTEYTNANIQTNYNNRRAWAYAVAAFFLQGQRETWPASADFSTAGKHSVWKNIIPEEYHDLGHFCITNELEWRKTVAAFFNHTNVLTYTLNSGVSKTEGTADFRNLGLPKPNGDPAAGWYNAWWNATFPEYMIDKEVLPKIKRKNYVFGGWYYGNEKGYIFTEGTKANPAAYSSANDDYKNHLWGRWLELCLYEGYVDADPAALDANEQPISPKVNNNVEMVICNAEEITRTGLSRKVDIERKLIGGTYNTMFLPFGINGQGTVKKDDDGNYISGSGICGKKYYLNQVIDDDGNPLLDPATTSILVYDGAEVENIGGEEVIAFNFHEYAEADSLELLSPYQPFLIKPEKDITVRMHFWSALMRKPATPKARTDANQVVVEGVLAPTMLPVNPEYVNTLILVADNRLAKVTTQGEMLGLRLYFTVPKDVSPSAQSIIRVNNAPAGIDDIETPQQGAAAIKILQNGTIYILRGNEIYTITGNRVK